MPALCTAASRADASPQKRPNLSSPAPQIEPCRSVPAAVGEPGEAERKGFQFITRLKDKTSVKFQAEIFLYLPVCGPDFEDSAVPDYRQRCRCSWWLLVEGLERGASLLAGSCPYES